MWCSPRCTSRPRHTRRPRRGTLHRRCPPDADTRHRRRRTDRRCKDCHRPYTKCRSPPWRRPGMQRRCRCNSRPGHTRRLKHDIELWSPQTHRSGRGCSTRCRSRQRHRCRLRCGIPRRRYRRGVGKRRQCRRIDRGYTDCRRRRTTSRSAVWRRSDRRRCCHCSCRPGRTRRPHRDTSPRSRQRHRSGRSCWPRCRFPRRHRHRPRHGMSHRHCRQGVGKRRRYRCTRRRCKDYRRPYTTFRSISSRRPDKQHYYPCSCRLDHTRQPRCGR